MYQYCIFWIPNIFHSDLQAPKRNDYTFRVDDDVTSIRRFITIEFIDLPRKNIKLSTDDNSILPLFLYEQQCCSNGLIKYEFNLDKLDQKSSGFWNKALLIPVYHAFKGFFHGHVFHPKDSDAFLSAYLTDRNIDICKPNNQALKHYLSAFEVTFRGYSDKALALHNEIHVVISQHDAKQEETATWYDKLYKTNQIMERNTNKVLGLELYYNTLLQSWDSVNSCGIDRRHRMNAQAAIASVKRLGEEIQQLFLHYSNHATLRQLSTFHTNVKRIEDLVSDNRDVLQASKRSAKISIGLAYLSVVLAILGIVLSVF